MDPSLELKYRSKKSCEREMEPERVQKRSSVPDFKLDKRRGSKVSSYSFFLNFFFFLNYTSLFLWPVYYWSSVVKNIDFFFFFIAYQFRIFETVSILIFCSIETLIPAVLSHSLFSLTASWDTAVPKWPCLLSFTHSAVFSSHISHSHWLNSILLWP